MNRHAEIAPLNTSFVNSTQFPPPCVNGNTESSRRGGRSSHRRSSLPPRPPHPKTPTTRQPIGLENFNPGPRIPLSISQQAPAPVLSLSSLPPMSPAPSSFRSSPSSPVANHSAALPPLPFTRPTALGASSSTGPPRKVHKRAYSDSVSAFNQLVPQGGMQLVYPRPMEMPVGVNASEESPGEEESDEEGANAYMDIVDQIYDVTTNGEGGERISGDSENGKSSGRENGRKATSGVKRARKEIAPSSGISGRSFSVDCNFNGGEESPELPPSPRDLEGVTNSVDGNENASQIRKPQYSASDMEKIMGSEKLQELFAANDFTRVNRILANRQSAARSKVRKAAYLNELEAKVDALKTENAALTAHSKLLARARWALEDENRELRIRVQGLNAQARLLEDLVENMKEVNRLKHVTGEVIPNPSAYERSNGQSVDEGMVQ